MANAQKQQDRKDRMVELVDAHKLHAAENAMFIQTLLYGEDKNKVKKNEKNCSRGSGTLCSRYCSKSLRPIYGDIFGDDEATEFCVNSLNKDLSSEKAKGYTHRCNLCDIESGDDFYELDDASFNLAFAILQAMHGNTANDERLSERLRGQIAYNIPTDYPTDAKHKRSILSVKVNGDEVIRYFIKMSSLSSRTRMSSPSGYKYKDRVSLGSMIKIQARGYPNLVFYVTRDESMTMDKEEEKKIPVVNCVSFWNLLKDPKKGEIRNLLHINEERAEFIRCGFYMARNNSYSPQINSIEVELHSHTNTNNKYTLLHWSSTQNVNSTSTKPTVKCDPYSNAHPSLSQSVDMNLPSVPISPFPVLPMNNQMDYNHSMAPVHNWQNNAVVSAPQQSYNQTMPLPFGCNLGSSNGHSPTYSSSSTGQGSSSPFDGHVIASPPCPLPPTTPTISMTDSYASYAPSRQRNSGLIGQHARYNPLNKPTFLFDDASSIMTNNDLLWNGNGARSVFTDSQSYLYREPIGYAQFNSVFD